MTTTISEIEQEILKNADNIKKIDTEEKLGLSMYSYITPSRFSNDFVKSVRGTILDVKGKVCYNPPMTEEFTSYYPSISNFEKCIIFPSYEGTFLRLFFYGNRWILSTNYRIDAFKSFWSSKQSHGEQFETELKKEGYESLKKLTEKLDSAYTYTFFLRTNRDNRIVCDIVNEDEPTVYFLGKYTRDSNGNFIEVILSPDDEELLPFMQEYSFPTEKDFITFLSKTDVRKLQGYLVKQPNGKLWKFVHPEYARLAAFRGNQPSLRFRYLQLRTLPECEHFSALYPESLELFEKTEEKLREISKVLHSIYMERCVGTINEEGKRIRNYYQIPTEQHQVIKECQKWYREHYEDSPRPRVTTMKVFEIMNSFTAPFLNRLLKGYLAPSKPMKPFKRLLQ